MRHHLHALKVEPQSYHKEDHSTLFKHMRMANDGKGRDHYHLREGQKEEMPFICLIKADLYSKNKYIKGKIGGRDDDRVRNDELLIIEFEVHTNDHGKVFIDINSTDRTTTYEESLKIVTHCLARMSHSSIELTTNSSGGNGKNKKGYYPQSAQITGMFSTFDKTFDKAVAGKVLPEELREFFREATYNLVAYNMESKKKVSRPKS